MHATRRSAGQVPREKGVHGSEQQIARLGLLSGARDVRKNPANLQSAEISRYRQPVLARNRSAPPARENLATSSATRISCHTSALVTGSPVFLFHTTVVSRWFVIPTAAKSDGRIFPCANASAMTSPVRRQISCGSCSTHPGLG